MLGSLPDDFLQLNGEGTSDGVPANYHPAMFGGFQQAGGVLNVTVVQVNFFLQLLKLYKWYKFSPQEGLFSCILVHYY